MVEECEIANAAAERSRFALGALQPSRFWSVDGLTGSDPFRETARIRDLLLPLVG
jgi:hypothetical protein